MGMIVFNGRASLDYGIQVEQPPEYQTPAKDYEFIHVPGRNGDVVLDNGSYKNASRTYKLSIGSMDSEFTSLANRISEWLHSASGYARLEDSYEPDYYRMAMFDEASTIENILGQAGRTTITFNCKPQRFLKSGEEGILCTTSTKIFNPTDFASSPILIVRFVSEIGSGGTISIGDYSISISTTAGLDSITVDSEIQDVYSEDLNANSLVSLPEGFPKLLPMENDITFSGNIASVEVIPKWWTL